MSTVDLVEITLSVLGLIATVLQMMGYSFHNLVYTKGPSRFHKRAVSRTKRMFLVLLIVLLLASLTWSLVDHAVWMVVYQYYPELLKGIGRTLGVSALAILFGTLIGSVCAYIVTAEQRSAWQTVVAAMLEGSIYFLLALPVIIVIFCVYYYSGRMDTLWVVATAALAINLSPFVAKILIGSIRSISKEQIDAARAFGYSDWDIARYFKINYVVSVSLQSLLVEYYTTIKLSSLTAYIGFREVWHLSQDIIKETQDPVTAYIVLALCYVVIVAPIALFADHLERSSRAKRHEA